MYKCDLCRVPIGGLKEGNHWFKTEGALVLKEGPFAFKLMFGQLKVCL